MSRGRGFIFTLNNYTDEQIAFLQNIPCQYIVFGKEVAPTTGTPHLQGYIYFTNPRSFVSLSKLYPWHLEQARGDSDSNRLYCSKDGVVFERGTKPISKKEVGQNEAARWQLARTAAMRGDYASIPDDLYIRYQSSFKRMRREDHPPAVDLESKLTYGVWIYGPTHTGKSHKARTDYSPLYLKDKNKWWDDYIPTYNVLIDEVDPSDTWMAAYIKKWVDRWTFSAEHKGGRSVLRPPLIIVTSNYSIKQCFPDDYEAIERRFEQIHLIQVYKI